MALSKENVKALAELVDDIIKLKGVLEMLDGIAASVLVRLLDEKVLNKIPEGYHDELNGFVDALEEKDYEKAAEFIADILSGIIPTPLVDNTDAEIELYRGILAALSVYLQQLIEKKGQPA